MSEVEHTKTEIKTCLEVVLYFAYLILRKWMLIHSRTCRAERGDAFDLDIAFSDHWSHLGLSYLFLMPVTAKEIENNFGGRMRGSQVRFRIFVTPYRLEYVLPMIEFDEQFLLQFVLLNDWDPLYVHY